jgi:hypothetical protein
VELRIVTTILTGHPCWLEAYLHRAFAHVHVRGEWFRLAPEDVDLIAGISVANDVTRLPDDIVHCYAVNAPPRMAVALQKRGWMRKYNVSAADAAAIEITASWNRMTAAKWVEHAVMRATVRLAGHPAVERRRLVRESVLQEAREFRDRIKVDWS